MLLVEEEGGIRTLVRKILHRNGYRVLEAGSSEEALAIAAAHAGPLELLITDMVLSGTSGRDLEDTLSQTRPEIKTIYVFGYTDSDVALAARLPEEATYLQKPFSLETLLKKVRELLGTIPEAGTATQGRVRARSGHVARWRH